MPTLRQARMGRISPKLDTSPIMDGAGLNLAAKGMRTVAGLAEQEYATRLQADLNRRAFETQKADGEFQTDYFQSEDRLRDWAETGGGEAWVQKVENDLGEQFRQHRLDRMQGLTPFEQEKFREANAQYDFGLQMQARQMAEERHDALRKQDTVLRTRDMMQTMQEATINTLPKPEVVQTGGTVDFYGRGGFERETASVVVDSPAPPVRIGVDPWRRSDPAVKGKMVKAGKSAKGGPRGYTLTRDVEFGSLTPGGHFASPVDRQKSRSDRTNNPGALNISKWQRSMPGFVGVTNDDGAGNKTAIYQTPEHGIAAWHTLITKRYSLPRRFTIGQLASKYGGGSSALYKNYTRAWKANGITASTLIDKNDPDMMLRLARGMFAHENADGKPTNLSDAQIMNGIRISMGQEPVMSVGDAVRAEVPEIGEVELPFADGDVISIPGEYERGWKAIDAVAPDVKLVYEGPLPDIESQIDSIVAKELPAIMSGYEDATAKRAEALQLREEVADQLLTAYRDHNPVMVKRMLEEGKLDAYIDLKAESAWYKNAEGEQRSQEAEALEPIAKQYQRQLAEARKSLNYYNDNEALRAKELDDARQKVITEASIQAARGGLPISAVREMRELLPASDYATLLGNAYKGADRNRAKLVAEAEQVARQQMAAQEAQEAQNKTNFQMEIHDAVEAAKTDVNVDRGELMAQINEGARSGYLSVAKRNEYYKALNKPIEDPAAYARSVVSGDLPAAQWASNHAAQMSKGYGALTRAPEWQEMSPAERHNARMQYSMAGNVAPKGLVNELKSAVTGSDFNKIKELLPTYNELADAGIAMEGLGTDNAALLNLAAQYDDAGEDGMEAIQKALGMRDRFDGTKEAKEALAAVKSKDVEDSWKKAAGELSDGWFIFKDGEARDAIHSNGSAMMAYEALFRREMVNNGHDEGLARKTAIDIMRQEWSLSGIGGRPNFMRNAPEKVYGLAQMSKGQNAAWIEQQAYSQAMGVAFEAGEAVPPDLDGVSLIPTPQSDRMEEPTYHLYTPSGEAVMVGGQRLEFKPEFNQTAIGRVEASKAAIADADRVLQYADSVRRNEIIRNGTTGEKAALVFNDAVTIFTDAIERSATNQEAVAEARAENRQMLEDQRAENRQAAVDAFDATKSAIRGMADRVDDTALGSLYFDLLGAQRDEGDRPQRDIMGAVTKFLSDITIPNAEGSYIPSEGPSPSFEAIELDEDGFVIPLQPIGGGSTVQALKRMDGQPIDPNVSPELRSLDGLTIPNIYTPIEPVAIPPLGGSPLEITITRPKGFSDGAGAEVVIPKGAPPEAYHYVEEAMKKGVKPYIIQQIVDMGAYLGGN